MQTLLNKLKKYIKETPRKQIEKDWSKLEEYNNVDPTVGEFIKSQGVVRGLNLEVLERQLDDASRASVRASVRDSIEASVRASVRDSVEKERKEILNDFINKSRSI